MTVLKTLKDALFEEHLRDKRIKLLTQGLEMALQELKCLKEPNEGQKHAINLLERLLILEKTYNAPK